MAVSNEDRDLVNEIVNAITWGPMLSVSTPGPDGERTINLRASAIVREVKAALIAHGWGPRPTVRQADIAAYATKVRPTRGASAPDIAAMHITAFLLQQGIEVTSD